MIPVLFCDGFTNMFFQSAITILFFLQLSIASYYTYSAGNMKTRNMHEKKAKELKEKAIQKTKKISEQGIKLASKGKNVVTKQIKKLKSKPDIPVEAQALPVKKTEPNKPPPVEAQALPVNKTGPNKPPPVVQGTLVVEGATPVQKRKGFFDRFFKTKK